MNSSLFKKRQKIHCYPLTSGYPWDPVATWLIASRIVWPCTIKHFPDENYGGWISHVTWFVYLHATFPRLPVIAFERWFLIINMHDVTIVWGVVSRLLHTDLVAYPTAFIFCHFYPAGNDQSSQSSRLFHESVAGDDPICQFPLPVSPVNFSSPPLVISLLLSTYQWISNSLSWFHHTNTIIRLPHHSIMLSHRLDLLGFWRATGIERQPGYCRFVLL